MRILSFLVTLTLIAATAAFFTKPDPQDVERQLKTVLFTELGKAELDDSRDGLGTAALIGCKLRPNDCYELLRSGLDLTYEDRTLYARIDLAGFGRRATCYGAFTKFACPGGLQKD